MAMHFMTQNQRLVHVPLGVYHPLLRKDIGSGVWAFASLGAISPRGIGPVYSRAAHVPLFLSPSLDPHI